MSATQSQVRKIMGSALSVGGGVGRTLLLLVAVGGVSQGWASEVGVTETSIKFGGVMDLKGDNKLRGEAVQAGIEAAFTGESVQGRSIKYSAVNDFYDPKVAVEATKQLLDQGVFALLGSVGTAQAKAVLPILAEKKVPSIGLFTGSNAVRPGVGDVIHYRASYNQEIAYLIDTGLARGVKPQEICAFVQDDSFGMSGVQAMKLALAKHPGMTEVTNKLDQVIAAKEGDQSRNNIGPVGVYTRDTIRSGPGYKSLKQWEQTAGTKCRLVLAVGPYKPIADLIAYSSYKNENWVIGAVSAVDSDSLTQALSEIKVGAKKIVVAQVVPALDSDLPIVHEARKALGPKLNYISIESFIDGKMVLAILRSIKGEITRAAFLSAARGHAFDLGGVKIDFRDDNQASDLVVLTSIRENGEFGSIPSQRLEEIFKP